MNHRDHEPVVLDKFNGLWDRNDPDSAPYDHFIFCNNIKYIGTNSFTSRDGIDISQDVSLPLTNIKRIYNFPTNTGNTLIVLVNDGTNGKIYHMINSSTVYGPLLTINGMTDFAFLPYAGRGYISPFTTYNIGGLNVEKGLSGESIYVYKGDGTAARLAAGLPLVGTLSISNGIAGHTDAGLHIFGFVAETDTGYLTPPGALTTFTTNANNSVSFGNVPTVKITTTISGGFSFFGFQSLFNEEYDLSSVLYNIPSSTPLYEDELQDEEGFDVPVVYTSSTTTVVNDPHIVRRHLVASKVITNFNGDLEGYQLFFVPGATIENNTDTFLNNISFYDQSLLDDASHLFDNYTTIPAVASLSLYHDRLTACTTYANISVGLVSHPGEPEAISQIDGIITVPPDGNPITNSIELRDVLYVMKRSRTVSFVDNGGEPSEWPMVTVDTALGTSVHGIATVLDSGGSNVDFLIICTYQGITIFNGRYSNPELSWKIENYWRNLNRNQFRRIQIVHAPIQKEIYTILPNGKLMVGNYGNGMEPIKMRWSPYTFNMEVNTIAIWNIDEVLIGSMI